MEILKIKVLYISKNLIEIRPEHVSIFRVHNNELLLKVHNSDTNYDVDFCRYTMTNYTEKYIFFEISNKIPLWIVDININVTTSVHHRIEIVVKIDPSMIGNYLKSSLSINKLLCDAYSELKLFTKFSDQISFPCYNQPKNPSNNFKINLFDYQKKTLNKMIGIENQGLNCKIPYTFDLNFLQQYKTKFDPVLNVEVENDKFFNLQCNGGVLADEMGLGKTITSLALIATNEYHDNVRTRYSLKHLFDKIASKATLIICPSHIAKQWYDEGLKCNPKFKILLILSKKDYEKIKYSHFINSDIIITTHQFLMNFKYYPSLHYQYITPSCFNSSHRMDILKKYFQDNINSNENINDETFNTIKQLNLPLFEFFYFHRLILDEGHEIFGEMLSNLSCARYMSNWINDIDSTSRWYVSGSPFVNYIGLINCIKFLGLELYEPELKIQINFQNIKSNLNFIDQILKKKYIWMSILEQICIRHRKCDLSDQITIHGYNEHIEWIEFTDFESKNYKTKIGKCNDYYLQQLCCHPLILESNRRILGTIDLDLCAIQGKLIEHHNEIIKKYQHKLVNLDTTNQAYHMLKKSYENYINESKYFLSMLEKLNDNTLLDETEKNCTICLEEMIKGSITKCGHVFCSDCLKNWLKFHKSCPMCKKNLTLEEIYNINKIEEINDINPLIKKYGSKLGKIIMMIRNIVLMEDSRIIIFSQWDDMLSLIGKTLSENGIANCFVKGNAFCRNSAISKFKSGKTLSGEPNKIIMLSLKNSASGTNLTEATHIFFVEPINSRIEEVEAIEGQAIGRACRLGQKQKVDIYRILIKNTIEEDIYNKIYKNMN
jgi:SNF2 family DNA or RNA helicase